MSPFFELDISRGAIAETISPGDCSLAIPEITMRSDVFVRRFFMRDGLAYGPQRDAFACRIRENSDAYPGITESHESGYVEHRQQRDICSA